jgi:hypothetical protein
MLATAAPAPIDPTEDGLADLRRDEIAGLRLVSLQKAAELLGVSSRTLLNWIAVGAIPKPWRPCGPRKRGFLRLVDLQEIIARQSQPAN